MTQHESGEAGMQRQIDALKAEVEQLKGANRELNKAVRYLQEKLRPNKG
jgi:cell division protein FtsB